jgi:hypothetical protein
MESQLFGGLAMEADWRNELETWLTPFVAALRNKTRGRMCPAYIAGLIGPGDRKSVQPMSARDGEVSYDRLHHFIGRYPSAEGRDLSRLSDRHPPGLPIPRKQLVEPLLRDIGDAGEDIGEPCLRIDVVEPSGGDERVHERGALAAAVGAGK